MRRDRVPDRVDLPDGAVSGRRPDGTVPVQEQVRGGREVVERPAAPRIDPDDLAAADKPQRAGAVSDADARAANRKPANNPAGTGVDPEHLEPEVLRFAHPDNASSRRHPVGRHPGQLDDLRHLPRRQVDAEEATLLRDREPRRSSEERDVGHAVPDRGDARDYPARSRVDQVERVRLQREDLPLDSGTTRVGPLRGDEAADRPAHSNEHRKRGEEPPAPRLRRLQRLSGVGDQLSAGLVTLVRLLRQRLPHHRLEARQNRRLLLQVREHDCSVGTASKRRPARQTLVQQAAERVEVGPAVQLLAADLLGRHVVDRAQRAPTAGIVGLLRQPSRQPEVGEIAVAALVEQDIRRLDVTVHKAAFVCRVERVRDLLDQAERTFGFELAASARSRFRSVPSTSRIAMYSCPADLARVVDRDDRRMIERCSQP